MQLKLVGRAVPARLPAVSSRSTSAAPVHHLVMGQFFLHIISRSGAVGHHALPHSGKTSNCIAPAENSGFILKVWLVNFQLHLINSVSSVHSV